MTRGFAVLVALVAFLSAAAGAVSLTESYWEARERSIARLGELVAANAAPERIRKVEEKALDELLRRVIALVGAVYVEGYAEVAHNHVSALTVSPDFGVLDGVVFSAPGHQGGGVVVTTEPLLALWLRETTKAHPAPLWADAPAAALKSDAFYAAALNPETGFDGVLDLDVALPPGATFAAAKLGRWGPATDSQTRPLLLVAVIAAGRVFIAATPSTRALAPPACKPRGGSELAEAFGPIDSEAFAEWRDCERRWLRTAPAAAELRHDAQELAGRLARANSP
jgi:hypothetical protein